MAVVEGLFRQFGRVLVAVASCREVKIRMNVYRCRQRGGCYRKVALSGGSTVLQFDIIIFDIS